jgi:redox-sensitive bicupin YhaK (pirin superfamily)
LDVRPHPHIGLATVTHADVALDQGAVLQMKPEHEERAAYVVEGSLEVGQARVPRLSPCATSPRST